MSSEYEGHGSIGIASDMQNHATDARLKQNTENSACTQQEFCTLRTSLLPQGSRTSIWIQTYMTQKRLPAKSYQVHVSSALCVCRNHEANSLVEGVDLMGLQILYDAGQRGQQLHNKGLILTDL